MIDAKQIAEWRALRDQGMTSAVGEYTPSEFWDALDEIDRLRAIVRKGREAYSRSGEREMPVLRTKDVIEALKRQDPDGTRVVFFRVYDESDPDDIVAHGAVDSIGLNLKDAYQAHEGDQNVLRVDLRLDCN